MSVRTDDFGNMIARREGREVLPPVMMGSHLDTVVAGGKYDGALGVVGALEVVRTLNDEDMTTRHPLEIINWTNEEGTRFQPALLGSGAALGVFDADEVYGKVDQDGVRFIDALREIGYEGSATNRPVEGRAYFELHIEQGPRLEQAGLQVGVVDGIIGDTWLRVDIRGQADHAGPTPMAGRRDALVAASDLVLAVNRIATEAGDDAVGTVGRMHVSPNVINTIPDHVQMSVDLRHPTLAGLDALVEQFKDAVRGVGETRGMDIDVDRYWTIEPVQFDTDLVEAVAAACRKLDLPDHHLWSGAGHDAKYAANHWPTTMIFARSEGGISHSEAEYSRPEDLAAATNVLLESVLQVAGN